MSIAIGRRAAPGKMIGRSDFEANQGLSHRSPNNWRKTPVILMLDIINKKAYIKSTFKAGFV